MKGHGGLVMRHGLQKNAVEDPGSSKLEGWGAPYRPLKYQLSLIIINPLTEAPDPPSGATVALIMRSPMAGIGLTAIIL